MNSKGRCKHCKATIPRKEGVTINMSLFCSYEHATAYGRAKAIAKQAKERKKDLLVKKKSLLKKSDYIKKAQAAVNAYIRARDYGKPCVSCGSMPDQKRGGTIDAGHYRSRGSAGHLRFNTFNIAAQCVKCNRYGAGNAVDFRLELINRLGLEIVERIEADQQRRDFTTEYLERIAKIFNKRARQVKKRKGLD